MKDIYSLMGHTVQALSMSPDRTRIVLDITWTNIHYKTVPDCCNEAWINHITGLDYLIGHEITGITLRCWESTEPSTRQEYDSVSVITLHTTRGSFDMEFRSSSNGYYNGSIERVTPPPDWDNTIRIQEDF